MSEDGDPIGQRVRAWMAAGETFEVEFKSEQRKALNDRDLVEVVVCLANGAGGVLLIGVEDDGTPTGARPRHEDGRTNPQRVQAMVANNTQPPVATTVHVVQIGEASVVVVEVPNSPRVVGTTQGTYLRRAIGGDGKPMCVPYHAHEMLASEIDRGATDFAALPVHHATWDDLDPMEFERVRRLVAQAGSRADRILADLADREIAHALGVVRHDAEVTIGSLLLFGRSEALRRFVPTHEAAFQVLRGLEVEVNDFFPFPLFRVADEMFSRFKVRNREEEVQFGLFRIAIPMYSETAFREALANALTHRDYTRRGAIYVRWSENSSRSPALEAFPKAFAWTTCWWPRHIRAARSSPTPSNAPGWRNGPAAGSTACSPTSFALAARRPITDAAVISRS
jgi:ATP-dependent DNA helicase RecG